MSFRERTGSWTALFLAVGVVGACGDGGRGSEPIDLDFENGGSSTGARGGSAGSSGSGARGGTSGASGSASVPGPPEVEAMGPGEGPYGTRVTISGSSLGSSNRTGVRLLVGDTGEVELDPSSEAVESWTEQEIVFRYPFPATGAVSLETPQGDALAGYFDPSFVATQRDPRPATGVIASLSSAPGGVFLLLDTSPPTLLELGPGAATEYAVVLGNAVASSVELYLNEEGDVEGVGLSDDSPPELVHLENVNGDLAASATGITLDATDIALAGGPDGACAWALEAPGWIRYRPTSAGWAEDLGPVAEPATEGDDRAFAATSDGTLHLSWAIDSGSLFDDMQRPVMRTLGSSGTWSAEETAGSSIDDYVTSLVLTSQGRGILLRYCGSDVDSTGLSGTEYRCYDTLLAQGGAMLGDRPVDAARSRVAFSSSRVFAGGCDSDDSYRIVSDADATGEIIVYPCQPPAALEIDPDGELVPVFHAGQNLYLLGRRP